MATNLDPQLLAQILSLRNMPAVDNGTSGAYWYDPRLTTDDPNAYILNQQYGYDYAQGDGGENQRNASKDLMRILKLRPDTGGKLGDMYDIQGNPLGTYDAQDAGGRQFNQAALMFGSALGGNLAMANGGAGAGSAGLTGWDAAMADAAASGSLTPASFGAAGAAGATGAAGAAGGVGGGALGGGSALGSVGSALGSLGANGSTVGGLLGAAAGALDSKDKTQSTSRDPWGPAQDFLKQQIAQGQKLSTQYQNQPFSPAQQTAYGNVGSYLDAINANAGGLLSGFGANASGANQFDRSNPNKKLVGSSFNMSGFAPGLLGFLGSK